MCVHYIVQTRVDLPSIMLEYVLDTLLVLAMFPKITIFCRYLSNLFCSVCSSKNFVRSHGKSIIAVYINFYTGLTYVINFHS